VVQFSTIQSTVVRFGAIQNMYGQNETSGAGCSGELGGNAGFPPSTSGIWGVGLPLNAALLPPMALDTIITNASLPNTIAICFDDPASSGSFEVGGIEPMDPRFTWMSLVSEIEYRFNMDNIVVGEHVIITNPATGDVSACLADSGTTDLVFPETVFNGLYQFFRCAK